MLINYLSTGIFQVAQRAYRIPWTNSGVKMVSMASIFVAEAAHVGATEQPVHSEGNIIEPIEPGLCSALEDMVLHKPEIKQTYE
jgi:hypothetical protein